MTIKRINTTPRWSDATIYNGIAHFVEVAADENADIVGQINQVFAQAEETLTLIGSNKSQLLSVSIYLTDLQYLHLFNDMWEAWLPAGTAPSRACLKVELVDPRLLVEITFVAAVTA